VLDSDIPLPLPEYPLSRGAAGGAGLRPTGLFDGGAGGPTFPCAPGQGPACTTPFALVVPLVVEGGGGGTERAATIGGAGGGAGFTTCSSRYADGAQPDPDPSRLFASHQPICAYQ